MNNRIIFFLIALLFFIVSCSTTKNVSKENYDKGKLFETGIASWYGPNFNGKQTANGEIYDMNKLTAAHRTLPFNSVVKVVNKSNNKSVIVRINDRGPYAKNRILDLSKKAAEEIELIENGTATVDLFLLSNHKIPNDLSTPKYSVQVGSYRNMDDAQRISSDIKNSRVVKVKINGDIYFRIYVGIFNTVAEADKQKRKLHQAGINGFVKQISTQSF